MQLWKSTIKPIAFVLASCLFCSFSLGAQTIGGSIFSDENSEPLAYVNVFLKVSKVGVLSDEKGQFELENTNIPDTLVLSLVGYETQVIPLNNPRADFSFRMKLANVNLNTVTVEAERSKVGKSIIKKVVANRAKVLPDSLQYSCNNYILTEIQKFIKKGKKDTTDIVEGYKVVYLDEYYDEQYHSGKNRKRKILAELNNSSDPDLKRYGAMDITSGFRGAGTFTTYNPVLFYQDPSELQIDLYEAKIRNTGLADRPIQSPTAKGCFANYKYRLTKMEFEGTDTIYTIQVSPFFKQEALFTGEIEILAPAYILKKASLKLPSNVVYGAKDFTLEMEYGEADTKGWRPLERHFSYETRMNGTKYLVDVKMNSSNFNLAASFEKNFFNNELAIYSVEALERDTSVWEKLRPVKLNVNQQEFASERDSVWHYEQSEEYLTKQDSIFNKNTAWDYLNNGVHWRNRLKGTEFGFDPFFETIIPLGVGGFRFRPGGYAEKEFLNKHKLRVRAHLNYGFNLKDWKGRINTSYTYMPRKFARVYVTAGDTYELLTFNQSISSILSYSNFVRKTSFGVGHSFEVVNGWYLETKLEYSDKQSLDGIELKNWTDFLFGDNNIPIPFERYKALIAIVNITWQPVQKYFIKGKKKIILGSAYPTFNLRYRRGIPSIFYSEVNYDHLELQVNQELPITKFGNTNYNLTAGSFLSKKSLRFIEHKYFRGSDPLIFPNPMFNMQLLGGTYSTTDFYMQASGIHHFNGFLLDKVPVVNLLQLETIVGAGTLYVPSEDLLHFEMYAGLGRKFKLWGEQLQVAFYTVTSDSSLNEVDIAYKVGLNFYNAFSGKWLY